MSAGELATRWTIRAALVCCAIAAAELLRDRQSARGGQARLWWTAGFVLYLAHVGAAFHFVHDWSHTAAYRHTAQQTYEMCGIDWGGGLYFNYVFTLAWFADVLSLWMRGRWQTRRMHRLRLAWYAFFAFMVINATIVFKDGPVRWLSLAALAVLGAWAVLRYKYK